MARRRIVPHASWAAWLAIAAAALAYLFRLGVPPGPGQPSVPPGYVYDECYQAFTAHRLTLHDPNVWNHLATRDDAQKLTVSDVTPQVAYEWVHPPTAKLVMAVFIRLLGFRPWAWRLGSVLCGLVVLLLVYRLALRFRDPSFAALTTVLLATDGLLFTMSRIAMTDVYLCASSCAAIFALYVSWTRQSHRSWIWQLGSGALFGLALSCKWSAASLLAGAVAVTLGRVIIDGIRGSGALPVGRSLLLWATSFLALPALVYVASYLPYFLAGHGLADFAAFQGQIWSYHHHLAATHTQSSRWWEWPLLTRPVWFYFNIFPNGWQANIYAMGNPIIWWLFLPAVAWVAVRFIRTHSIADGCILFGFFGAWLPWAFVGRVAFLQYMLPAMPFGVLAIASVLDDLRRWDPIFAARTRLIYAALCIAAFIHFYPLWSARPLPSELLRGRRYFWITEWRGDHGRS